MKKIFFTVLTALLVCAIGLALGEALIEKKGTGITVISPAEWESQFPNEYATYQANSENSEVVE